MVQIFVRRKGQRYVSECFFVCVYNTKLVLCENTEPYNWLFSNYNVFQAKGGGRGEEGEGKKKPQEHKGK